MPKVLCFDAAEPHLESPDVWPHAHLVTPKSEDELLRERESAALALFCRVSMVTERRLVLPSDASSLVSGRGATSSHLGDLGTDGPLSSLTPLWVVLLVMMKRLKL